MGDKRAPQVLWRNQLLTSLVLGDGSVAERVFRARAVARMLASEDLRGPGLFADELLVLVEDVSGMLPGSQALALLEGTRLLELRDDHYFLRGTVNVTDFSGRGEQRLSRALAALEWTIEDLRPVFLPRVEKPVWTVRDVRDAVHGGYRWLLGTLENDADGRPRHPVLPAFWSCDEAIDTPIGMLPAVTSVGDSLAALADGVRRDVAVGHVAGHHGPAIANAVRQLLTYRVEHEPPDGWDERLCAWNAGGFLPYDDQPEAAYPTVDATWDALVALSSVVDGPAVDFGLSAAEMERVQEYSLTSTRFLLRMQLDCGGWGIYRYLDEAAQVPPFEFTTGQSILSLGLMLGTDLLAEDANACLRAQVEAALRRAWGFLVDASVRADGLTAWAPYFRQDVDLVPPTDLLCSTCWAHTGVLMLFGLFPDLQAEIAPALADLVTLAERHWRPDYGRLADASFRVPLAAGLNDTFSKWSNRYDVTVAIALLALFEQCVNADRDVLMAPDLWQRIERTVGEVLDEQHLGHGHWAEPVDGRPLAAATAMALLLLQSYLAASIAIASGRDVVPRQG